MYIIIYIIIIIYFLLMWKIKFTVKRKMNQMKRKISPACAKKASFFHCIITKISYWIIKGILQKK